MALDSPAAPSLVAVLGSVTPPGRLHRAVGEALDRLAARTAVATRLVDLYEVDGGAHAGAPG